MTDLKSDSGSIERALKRKVEDLERQNKILEDDNLKFAGKNRKLENENKILSNNFMSSNTFVLQLLETTIKNNDIETSRKILSKAKHKNPKVMYIRLANVAYSLIMLSCP